MDIQYLLFLQDFRNSINDFLTPFMKAVSDFTISWLLLLPVFIYWCLNKRMGLFTLAGYSLGRWLNSLVKLTACVYRPWIRDPAVIPADGAKKTATGYSFPSGHCTSAMALYGGTAIGFWKTKKTRILSILFFFMILLTAFSRNYLGVHTPQDVITGLVLMSLCLFVTGKIFSFLEKYPEKENFFLLGGLILSLLMIIYISLKPYPMDYDAAGKLIVDPKKMMEDGFKDAGILAGFCIGRFVEKKWIQFNVAGLSPRGVILSLVGFIPLELIYISRHSFAPLLGKQAGNFVSHALLIIFIIAIWPLVIKLMSKWCKKN